MLYARLRRLLPDVSYLAALLLSLVAARGAWILGVATPELCCSLAVLLSAGLIGWLEQLRPLDRQPSPARRTMLLDLAHTLISAKVLAPVMQVGLLLAAAAVASRLGTQRGLGVWPTTWPLFAQLLLAIPLADFGAYWLHRLMHATMPGWRIHALHHSPRKLYFLASARTHPLNLVVTVASQHGVLLLLGIGADGLLLWSVFHAVNGLLQHSNIDFAPRLLSGVLTTNVVHWRHHARDFAPSNFGNMTMLWDRLFGTFVLPPPGPIAVGIAGEEIRESYLAHLASPFELARSQES